MNGIPGYSSGQVNPALDAKTRFAPKLKPEIERVAGNPFYPDGRTPARSTEETRQVFESNLPDTQQEESQKVGTILNTLA